MNISITPLFLSDPESTIRETVSVEKKYFTQNIEEFSALSDFSAELQIYRSGEDIVCVLENALVSGEMLCARCLQEGNVDVQFSDVEQIFYAKRSAELGEEEFFIDQERQSINILPFVVQEVQVHVPDVFVHDPKDCDPEVLKGLEQAEENTMRSPFADLAQMLEQSKGES